MKKTVLFVSLVFLSFFAFVSFYVTRKFQSSELTVPSVSEKPVLKKEFPKPRKEQRKQSKKRVEITGCVIKDNDCSCYMKNGEQLKPSISVCEDYIKRSGGSRFITIPDFDDDVLRVLNALSDNGSSR